ncbi:putative 1-phosphatidylinositol 3-phosphate 5-kinase [Anoplophora glabripennis]|uniref:putative 1-phosphatidylinositol 3-phosphate 5-kinase n=1 Tax=Anoplophora glabripennis TaxID=217634 RepID=UPI0008747723|nr:putative 1-phosphatidylinositol 3-phosphate 5-kinase [Anoplophora glabripennis]
MNKNLQSPTKLTEFAPLQPEERPQSVGQLISNFFKITKNTTQVEQTSETLDNDGQESLPNWAINSSVEAYAGKESTANVYNVDVNEGRSLPNVLKRISNLLALKSTSLQDYGDTELKQYWMPDSVSKECYECSEKFTTFRRRHHCRVCGQIFCSQCCNQQIPGKIFGCTGDLRVCTYCCKVVLSYLQTSDLGTDLSTDLKILQENLQSKFGSSLSPRDLEDNVTQSLCNNMTEGNTAKRKISVGYQEEKFASGSSHVTYLTTEEKCKALQNSISLRNLFEEICKPTTGVPFDTHRYRLRTYTQCILGSELVDWLIFQQKANNRVQASAICQALLEGGYIENASETASFIDGYAFYKRGSLMTLPQPEKRIEISSQEEPSWVQQIPQESSMTDSDNEQTSPINLNQGNLTSSSSYMLDLNLEANTVYLSRPFEAGYKSPDSIEPDYKEQQETTIVRPSEQRELAPESGWFNVSALRDENGEKLAYGLLSETYEQHEQSLMKQLLSFKGLSHSWSDIIIPLIHNIITVIRPDKNHDAVDLDIRHYVQFKILTGNLRKETALVGGIVCSKNVAHKGMLTELENPRILLLQCSIVYQRTEGRLMSLEPVLMQEHEYLRNVAARIVALQPNIVLVQRNVSRLAQDMLRQHKITLVQNVKQSVLERLARCTEADIVSAVDAHIGRPKLGTCKRFYVKSFDTERGGVKTLMFFDGLPLPHLGGTVLLRGGSKAELIQMKKVASFMLFTAYNWRLEKSFLMDEFAMPPNTKCEFLEDSKENSPDFPTPKTITNLNSKLLGSASETEKPTVAKKSNNEKNEIVIEAKKITVETIKDFTDPLHSYTLENETTKVDTGETFTVAELPLSNIFRKWLDDAILCISPFIVFSVPYLETEFGKKCKLRQFFPRYIYFSEQFGNNKKNKWKEELTPVDRNSNNKKIKPLHAFLKTKITTNVEDVNIQNSLANFRACGGRYEKKENICIVTKKDDIKKTLELEQESTKDVLDPTNHQKLAVLFCSFSAESNNAPAFCVNPWVVFMDFYGRNDIPLGCFLERYCFRPTYYCPSKSCDTPMVKHTRRFVHNSGCVSISLNYFENEFSEESIVMWTWCTKCQSVSPVVPMSADTWSYSFAKYLESKFHGDVFSRRGQYSCNHSLHHDHYQYFGFKNYVASFKYTYINIWEISLPPLLIEITNDANQFQSKLIDEVRIMAQKGHEIFSLIQDKLSYSPVDELENIGNLKQLLCKEQVLFKQKVEEVQLKLTSPTIENKDFEEKELYAAYWKISDVLIKIKKSIVETVDVWNVRLSEATRKKDTDKKKDKPSQIESDSSVDETVTSELSNELQINEQPEKGTSNLIFKKLKSLDNEYDYHSPSSPKSHHRTYSDDGTVMIQSEDVNDGKKESDKKTVKNILSQLLPSVHTLTSISPPFGVQEHYTLPLGTSIPIVVYENEPSSIISYTLNSVDYKKAFEDLTIKKNAEQSPSPVTKRKSNSDKEKSDDDKSLNLLGFLRNKDSKPDLVNSPLNSTNSDANQSDQTSPATEKTEDTKKSRNCHIDVQFQDPNCNFFCRVYLAEKFATLRSLVLPMGEEAYVRSLSRSVQWNARGGKSGSNFSKTADDRFILKEMSKSEVQLFLESASNYFVYMHKSYTTKQPTLLGKIVGIYQIIFRNNSNIAYRNNLLVMENLFYNRKVTQKFDLKGSMRNRLVVPENQEGEIVLLDENLLKMTCDSPLYILPHSKAVLTAAIQNDTEFLFTQSVMDYSLLVGLDPENKELVLGIIDYIRTFTWDKRLETIVKKSGFLGGQGKLPTIVSPEEYQKRFIEAMHRYFLEVPDHWAGLGKGLDI